MKTKNLINALLESETISEQNRIPESKQLNKMDDILSSLTDSILKLRDSLNLSTGQSKFLSVVFDRHKTDKHSKGIHLKLNDNGFSNNHEVYLSPQKDNDNRYKIIGYTVTIDGRPTDIIIPSREEVSQGVYDNTAKQILDTLLPVMEEECSNNSVVSKTLITLESELEPYRAAVDEYNNNIVDKDGNTIASLDITNDTISCGKISAKIKDLSDESNITKFVRDLVNYLFPKEQLSMDLK